MGRRYDVAIYAPRAWPLYAVPPRASPGGAEVQMRQLAGALAEQGLRVCHIVGADPSLPPSVDGVDLVQVKPASVADSRLARARRLFHALHRADARVYVQRSAGPDAGLVALFARSRRRHYVLSTSWDGDLTAPLIPRRVSRATYRLGVRLADVIVVQTDDQMAAAGELVKRPLEMIRSIAQSHPDAGLEREAFLWIGRIVDYKDPLAYADLAERAPEARFWMVADTSGNEDVRLTARLRARAGSLPNLELLDIRPREELADLYNRAVAVVNTSLIEGFPNTFMEGWARGAPALSLRLDPDRIIERHRLGVCAHGSHEQLVSAARETWAKGVDPGFGERARHYIATEHAPAAIAARWQDLLESLGSVE